MVRKIRVKAAAMIAVAGWLTYAAVPSPSADVTAAEATPDVKAPVASVAGAQISIDDLESYLAFRPPAQGIEQNEGLKLRLNEMILTEVLHREALRLEIDKIPEVARSIRQLVVQRLLEEKVERPIRERKLDEEELRAFYDKHHAEYNRPEQVRLVDIFFSASGGGDASVRTEKQGQAEVVLQKALSLQDTRFGFGELLLKHSDPHEKFANGDTGFFGRDGVPAGVHRNLAEAAFSIPKVGRVAPKVIETPEGFHVAMLVGRRAAESREFDDVRGEIDRRIRRKETRKAREAYLKDLKEKADVTIDDDMVEAIARKIREKKTEHAEKLDQLRRRSGESMVPPPMPGGGK